MYRNTTDFCILILLNSISLLSSISFFRFNKVLYIIMLFVTKNVTPSFPVSMPFCVSYLIPSALLNRRYGNRHSCLFHCLQGEAFYLLILSMMLVIVFLLMPFIKLSKFPSIPSLLIILSGIEFGFCQTFFVCVPLLR